MALLAGLWACGFATPGLRDGGTGGDDGGGGDVDAPDGGDGCFGTLVQICLTAMPTMAVAFQGSQNTIDTSVGAMCYPDHDKVDDYCVIAGTSLRVVANSIVRGVGPRPLVLVSTSSLVIEPSAIVDVSSNTASSGAAADPDVMCKDTAGMEDFSGGFGGSFGGKGGTGEPNDGGPKTADDPLPAPPSTLRGGCPGGRGGTRPVTGGIPGAGGRGGGAVALIAGERIQLDGSINASGAGGIGGGKGAGSSLRSGGGGGGSGGMIVLDAPTIARGANGFLFANGGGGGQGGAGPIGPAPGEDGRISTAPAVQAPGGVNNGKDGGSGGPGSGGATLVGGDGGTTSAVLDGGGGGGGGGAGFIRVRGATITGNAIISPPAWVPP
jgi:hypothetical protein